MNGLLWVSRDSLEYAAKTELVGNVGSLESSPFFQLQEHRYLDFFLPRFAKRVVIANNINPLGDAIGGDLLLFSRRIYHDLALYLDVHQRYNKPIQAQCSGRFDLLDQFSLHSKTFQFCHG